MTENAVKAVYQALPTASEELSFAQSDRAQWPDSPTYWPNVLTQLYLVIS